MRQLEHKNEVRRRLRRFNLEDFFKSIESGMEQKHTCELLAAMITLLVLLIALVVVGVWPFGDRAIMIIDSYHQYVPFFSELHEKIWTGDSLFYSWHGSLGFDFWAVMAYYLASPLNILIAAFPVGMMLEAFECLIVLKLTLASVTACIYLKHRSEKKDYFTVLASCFYGLSGFMVAYNWNVMWLDCIVLFPLIILGVERLVDKGSAWLYVITLGLAIFCNYYIAIMICIFVCLYFFAYWFSKKRQSVKLFFKRGFLFAGASILSGGLAAVYLLPTYFTMIGSSQGSKPSKLEFYNSFLDLISQHMADIEPTELTGMANIYCGILMAMLAAFFVFAKGIRLRDKICRCLLCAFMLFSLNFNVLDYIWHGFHFPNNLPGRFSFIYIFMVLTMGYDAFRQLPKMKDRYFYVISAAEVIFLMACMAYGEEIQPTYVYVITAVFMALYVLLMWFSKHDIRPVIKGHAVNMFNLLVLVMLIEVGMNTIYGFDANGSVGRSAYLTDQEDISELRELLSDDGTFYRTELNGIHARDEVTFNHLNGLSFFSSTADDHMEKLMGALGYFNNGNKYSYKGATPLTDALFNIRYVFSIDKWAETDHQSLVKQTQLKYVYENDSILSTGYMISSAIRDWTIYEGSPFEIQNDFVKKAADMDAQLFEKLPVTEPELVNSTLSYYDDTVDTYRYTKDAEDGSMTFDLSFDTTQDVYLYFEAAHSENLKVTIDGVSATYSDKSGHIVHLGTCGPDTTVQLYFLFNNEYTSGNVKLQVYAYQPEVFEAAYAALSDEQWDVTEYNSTHLSGTVTAAQDGIFMTSVPYDEGWKILVDGVQVSQERVGEALTGIAITAGTHTIEMTYTPRGFTVGLIISISSVLIFSGICAVLLYRCRRR